MYSNIKIIPNITFLILPLPELKNTLGLLDALERFSSTSTGHYERFRAKNEEKFNNLL